MFININMIIQKLAYNNIIINMISSFKNEYIFILLHSIGFLKFSNS